MEEQKNLTHMGGTMRLGEFACHIQSDTKAASVYPSMDVMERHRHRYEFNNRYRALLQEHGMIFSGVNQERDLVEIVELQGHPWFVSCQFHPEFASRPCRPHPLFFGFVQAALERKHQGGSSVRNSLESVVRPSLEDSSSVLSR